MCTAAPPWAEVGTHPSQTAPRVARHCMRAAPSRRPRGSAPSRRRAPRLAHADSASTRAPRPAAARAHHPHQQSQKRDTERPKARPHLEARVLLQPHRRPDQVDRLNHQRRRRPDRRRRGSSDRGHFMSCTAQGRGCRTFSHTRTVRWSTWGKDPRTRPHTARGWWRRGRGCRCCSGRSAARAHACKMRSRLRLASRPTCAWA
jgi:hypothetical protein